MKNVLFTGALLLLAGAATATATAMDRPAAAIAATPQDAADIRQVMESFHHAVATHDGQTLSALFLDHGSAWVTVLSDRAYAAAIAKDPARQKIRIGSYQAFARFVTATKSALDPRHADLRIMSDGAVAAVYFHFDFMIDGKAENRGDETWQLVKTADGWRIVAIAYSSDPGAA